MEYPVWFLPGFSKGLIIATVAVLHVFVAHFAVGGGIFLVAMERRAHALNSAPLLDWLERHSHFFMLLTMVFGGLSGVGIWFTISVISPAATSFLVHDFLFIWAAEWAFFLLEIVSLVAYYYTYRLCRDGRMPPRTHMRIGLVYAGSGFMSLFLVNGIVSFMLTPGAALEHGSLWQGFFNPGFWPSVVYRTALSLLIAGMFALFTVARIRNDGARRFAARQSALWITIPFVLLALSSYWYYLALPPDRQAAVLRRTADIHPFVTAYGWLLPVIFLAGVYAFIRAERLRRPLTVVILATGLMLIGSYEWIRETGRRPWIIPGHMYSNGFTVEEGAFAAENGMAAGSGWSALVRAADRAAVKGSPAPAISHGAYLFAAQCGPCHGTGGPTLDLLPRIRNLTPDGLAAQLRGQGLRQSYMPPFFGNERDIADLAAYLRTLKE